MKKLNVPGTSLLFLLLIHAAVMSGCSPPADAVTQYSTIDALLAGAYDGFVELTELDRAGNLGIGTFDRLDGEMIFLDDEFWKARSDGTMVRVDGQETTPFASVCEFRPEFSEELQPAASLGGLTEALDGFCKNNNGIYAVRIRGDFDYVRTRSVPPQDKPYPPLAEITRTQPEFETFGSSGTIVGFRLPPYIKGLNVPGWHLHYISDDRSSGGHVLQLELKNGSCEIDSLTRLTVELDKSGRGMSGLDLTIDRSEELKQVEGTE